MKIKTNKKILLLLPVIILTLVFVMTGCQGKTTQTSIADISTTSVTAAETTGVETTTTTDPYKVVYPVTIEDDKGQQEGFENRKLVFDAPVESVIAGENNFSMCLKEFGKLDKVKGIAYWVPDAVPELKDSEQIIAAGGLNLEALINIKPELMVTISESYWEPSIVEQVEAAGIKIYSIGVVNSLDHIKKYINDYGQMFDCAEKAESLVTGMEEKQVKVKAAVESKGKAEAEKPTVIYCMSLANESGDWVPGSDTFVDQIITEAGGINLPAQQGISGWGEYSVEKLLESDPDIILIPISESGNDDGMSNFTKLEDFTKNKLVQNLKAVKENKVYAVIRENINNLSFTTADSLVEFAEAINDIKIE